MISNDYFTELELENDFVSFADKLFVIKNNNKDLPSNTYTDFSHDIVNVLTKDQTVLKTSIVKFSGSIPFKKLDCGSFIVVPLHRMKDRFCFMKDNKIKRLRFTTPVLINGNCMWGCPENDIDLYLVVIELKDSYKETTVA